MNKVHNARTEFDAKRHLLEQHVKACWNVLYEHAAKSPCNCFNAPYGTVIVTHCLLGRNAQEEYDLALGRLEEYLAGVVTCNLI